MSSIVLPPRGQCIELTGNLQRCQCLSFGLALDQQICGRCGHGIHAHRDYVSMFVFECPVMNCAAYYPKTSRVQACICSASLMEHRPVVNVYRLPATLPYGADADSALPSTVNTFTGDTANIPFTPVPIPSPSTTGNPSYSYGDVVIFTPTPRPVIQTTFTQIDTHSHSEVENPYVPQYQNDNSTFVNNVQDSGTRFQEDYSANYVPVHGMEAWAGRFE
ncbi:hypothetical protein F5146DRAFT_1130451 [Armillaria mellea]|nr:hypothetical protein F5146DRAFT_346668 [Armillaria mellea]KAK0197592.1 hypothetical protein F5146DRAFT_1130451 [Armillaria mellea]